MTSTNVTITTKPSTSSTSTKPKPVQKYFQPKRGRPKLKRKSWRQLGWRKKKKKEVIINHLKWLEVVHHWFESIDLSLWNVMSIKEYKALCLNIKHDYFLEPKNIEEIVMYANLLFKKWSKILKFDDKNEGYIVVKMWYIDWEMNNNDYLNIDLLVDADIYHFLKFFENLIPLINENILVVRQDRSNKTIIDVWEMNDNYIMLRNHGKWNGWIFCIIFNSLTDWQCDAKIKRSLLVVKTYWKFESVATNLWLTWNHWRTLQIEYNVMLRNIDASCLKRIDLYWDFDSNDNTMGDIARSIKIMTYGSVYKYDANGQYLPDFHTTKRYTSTIHENNTIYYKSDKAKTQKKNWESEEQNKNRIQKTTSGKKSKARIFRLYNKYLDSLTKKKLFLYPYVNINTRRFEAEHWPLFIKSTLQLLIEEYTKNWDDCDVKAMDIYIYLLSEIKNKTHKREWKDKGTKAFMLPFEVVTEVKQNILDRSIQVAKIEEEIERKYRIYKALDFCKKEYENFYSKTTMTIEQEVEMLDYKSLWMRWMQKKITKERLQSQVVVVQDEVQDLVVLDQAQVVQVVQDQLKLNALDIFILEKIIKQKITKEALFVMQNCTKKYNDYTDITMVQEESFLYFN
jgi:hypothetical protein